jgi:hypothetical protein
MAQLGCSVAQVRVQRGSDGSALACCNAGPSSNLGSATHGMLWMNDICMYLSNKRQRNAKGVTNGHQTLFLTHWPFKLIST